MEPRKFSSELSKAQGKQFNSHLLKAHIEKRVKIFGQNLDYKNRSPTKTNYEPPNKIRIEEDFITSVRSKKVLLSKNPKDTDPFHIGTTGYNLNNAL